MSFELSVLSAALASCVVYIIHMNRQDQKNMKEELTKSIHGLRADVQNCTTKVAVLEERLRHREEAHESRA